MRCLLHIHTVCFGHCRLHEEPEYGARCVCKVHTITTTTATSRGVASSPALLPWPAARACTGTFRDKRPAAQPRQARRSSLLLFMLTLPLPV